MRAMWIVLLLGFLFAAMRAAAEEAGVVAGIVGAPTVTRGGTAQPLRRGGAVPVGDRIGTDAAARVKILLRDDSVLSIGSGTEIVIDQLLLAGTRTGRLRVLVGRFKLAIAAWFGGGASDYEIETPTAVAGVRGTVLWGDTALDAICALQGSVAVRTVKGDATATVTAGECVTGMAAGETKPLVPTREQLATYLSEVSLQPAAP